MRYTAQMGSALHLSPRDPSTSLHTRRWLALTSHILLALGLWSGLIGCSTAHFSQRKHQHDGMLGHDLNLLPGNPGRDPHASFRSPLEIRMGPAVFNGIATKVYEHPIPHQPARSFKRAILSWNIITPPGTGAWFEVRAWREHPLKLNASDGVQAGWTPWLFIGEWGDVAPETAGWRLQTAADHTRIEVDEFVSDVPWDLLQWRVVVASRVPEQSVTIDNIVVSSCVDSPFNDAGVDSTVIPNAPPLSVPFFTQKTDNPALSGRLCSPTSVSMVLSFHGNDVTVQQVAARAYDRRHDIYGNWPRNVQAAFELGLSGAVVRFASWEQLAEQLMLGRPVVISFAADKGELRNAPYESTSGHLIVVHGFDKNGDVLVSDPACGSEAEGRRTYPRDDLTRVWLQKSRGTAYVLWPRKASTPIPIRELSTPETASNAP